jgi:hypothetical protein
MVDALQLGVNALPLKIRAIGVVQIVHSAMHHILVICALILCLGRLYFWAIVLAVIFS